MKAERLCLDSAVVLLSSLSYWIPLETPNNCVRMASTLIGALVCRVYTSGVRLRVCLHCTDRNSLRERRVGSILDWSVPSQTSHLGSGNFIKVALLYFLQKEDVCKEATVCVCAHIPVQSVTQSN